MDSKSVPESQPVQYLVLLRIVYGGIVARCLTLRPYPQGMATDDPLELRRVGYTGTFRFGEATDDEFQLDMGTGLLFSASETLGLEAARADGGGEDGPDAGVRLRGALRW